MTIKSPTKRSKHNHEVNLGIVLKELRDSTQFGGVSLEHLVNLCEVSKRHIYRYLKELEEMGIPIERPQITKPGKAGVGLYKLKDVHEKETIGETMLLAALNQMLEQCFIYQNHVIFLQQLVLQNMAARYGFKLPMTLLFNK